MKYRYVDLVVEAFNVAVRIGALADSRLVARRLVPSQSMLCASPAYLHKYGVLVGQLILINTPAWCSLALRFGTGCAYNALTRHPP
ncbi:MAG: hypothetical protein ACSLEN_06000 [Candidatus Malihini olakiniferum]